MILGNVRLLDGLAFFVSLPIARQTCIGRRRDNHLPVVVPEAKVADLETFFLEW